MSRKELAAVLRDVNEIAGRLEAVGMRVYERGGV